ncbi:MAG: protein kinase [Rhodothermales bacterium]
MHPGTRISHFEIESLLGRGGMGEVYKAVDVKLGRPVALKFLPLRHSHNEAARSRFEVEARAASALDHPNICSIYEIGEADDGSLFIAMAYYPGETLDKRLERGPVSVDEAVAIVRQVAAGLEAAHEADIVHRDIKPGNIVVTERGEVKILDFGLAKMQNLALTQEGSTFGTVLYMSPEQIMGGEIDRRSDVWALGVLLYQLISGRLPFAGEYAQAISYLVVHGEAAALDEAPEEIRVVVNRCLEKRPEDRYASAQEVADALLSSIGGSEGWLERPGATLGRALQSKRGKVWVTAILLAGLLSALSIQWLTEPGLPAAKHIAVLPFANVGENPENQSYVDGLVYAVSSKIASMERFQSSLRVVPASDVFGKHLTTSDEAAKELDVNLAITGSVWIGSDVLQLTLNLVDAATGRLLRTAVLEEKQSNVGHIQDGVVRKLAELIDLELNPADEQVLHAGATTVPGAYQFYLQGLGYLSHFENHEDVRRAIELFHSAVETDDKFALGYAGLGEAFWRSYEATLNASEADSAVAYSKIAVGLDDRLAEVWNTIGLVHNGTGHYKEAEKAFREAIRIDPAYAAAYRNLGLTFELTNRMTEAEQSLQEAVARKPDYWSYYNTLGIFYHNRGEHQKAAEQFEQVVKLAPDNPWGYNNLAVQYQRLGKPEKAAPLYEKATTADPSAAAPTALAYKNLAFMAYSDDDYGRAANLYAKSLEHQPKSATTWMDLGGVYHWLGNDSAATDAWQRSIAISRANLEVNPKFNDGLRNLVMVYAMLGREDSSLVFVDSLMRLPGLGSADYLAVGKAYEILGRRQPAITFVTRAVDKGHSWSSIESSAWLDSLRVDPDFRALVRLDKP